MDGGQFRYVRQNFITESNFMSLFILLLSAQLCDDGLCFEPSRNFCTILQNHVMSRHYNVTSHLRNYIVMSATWRRVFADSIILGITL